MHNVFVLCSLLICFGFCKLQDLKIGHQLAENEKVCTQLNLQEPKAAVASEQRIKNFTQTHTTAYKFTRPKSTSQ